MYVGDSAEGTGEWFVAEPQVALPTLGSGTFYVRVRALDTAGGTSPWATLLVLTLP